MPLGVVKGYVVTVEGKCTCCKEQTHFQAAPLGENRDLEAEVAAGPSLVADFECGRCEGERLYRRTAQ